MTEIFIFLVHGADFCCCSWRPRGTNCRRVYSFNRDNRFVLRSAKFAIIIFYWNSDDHRRTDRTVKYIVALAKDKPIVDIGWIQDFINLNKLFNWVRIYRNYCFIFTKNVRYDPKNLSKFLGLKISFLLILIRNARETICMYFLERVFSVWR